MEFSSPRVKLSSNRVWAYNLFADPYTDGYSYVNPWPRIIIRLTDVKLKNGYEYTEDQFLTVKGIKEAIHPAAKEVSDNKANVKSKIPAKFAMEAGKIYKFTNIRFNEGNLTPIPNISSLEIEVTVDIVYWAVEEVEAIL